MKVLIVDDESLARSRLKRLLAADVDVVCVGEASSGQEAIEKCSQLSPEVVFLDIEMPDADGLSIAAQLQHLTEAPQVVFVTAHPQHALAAYQVAPADYLLKPVSAERLALTLSRLKAKLLATPAKLSTAWLTYKSGLTTRRVLLSDIVYFQAEDKYVRMVFGQGEALIEQSLKQLEEQFPHQLTRIHRNTLVLTDKIKGLHQTSDGRHLLELDQSTERLEISRRELTKLRQMLNLGR